MVTLYRIYKIRPDLDDSIPSAWALWPDSHAAGDLAWCGVLRDAGNVGGNGIWSIDCHGMDAMVRRTLGTRNSPGWMKFTAEPGVRDEQKFFAIGFQSRASAAATNPGLDTFYNALVFPPAAPLTGTTRDEIAAELDQHIENVMDGTTTNVAFPGGDFDTWADGTLIGQDAGVSNQGVFFVKRLAATNDEMEWGGMYVCMHEEYWLALGFEPWRQDVNSNIFTDATHVDFHKLESGEMLTFHSWITGEAVPDEGYWVARFTTVRAGTMHNNLTPDGYDNDGSPREWYPMHPSGVFRINRSGGQVLRLVDMDGESLRLEGQPTATQSASDRARHEAGHAVVALAMDAIPTRLDLVEAGDRFGEMHWQHPVWWTPRHHAAMLLAGGLAVNPDARCTHDLIAAGGRQDCERAFALGDDELITEGWLLALDLLDRFRPLVDAIAKALEANPQGLDTRAIEAVVRTVPGATVALLASRRSAEAVL
jgi:hypothetical protein